jgi:uncharacterized protein YyaL (SSP411 family)
VEIVTVGKPGDPALEALLAGAARVYLPHVAWASVWPERREGRSLPLTMDKSLLGGAPALYLCRNFTCQAPIVDPGAVVPALQQIGAR